MADILIFSGTEKHKCCTSMYSNNKSICLRYATSETGKFGFLITFPHIPTMPCEVLDPCDLPASVSSTRGFRGSCPIFEPQPRHSTERIINCCSQGMPKPGKHGYQMGRVDYLPICSMNGIFTYIWVIFRAHVGKYSIHGAYGLGSGKNPFIQVPFTGLVPHQAGKKMVKKFTSYDSWMMILQVPSCWIYGRFRPVGGFPSTSKWLETTTSWVNSWVVHQTAAFCSRETYNRHRFLTGAKRREWMGCWGLLGWWHY